ncbi:hypothetical protein Tco_0489085 [Tanacetum coccineum]
MSTRSTSSNLFSPLRDPESLIRRRNLGEPSSLFDFEETMSIPHNNQGPPYAGPPPQNNNGPPLVVRPNGPAPDLRSMEELCQPSINGRGGPIAPIPIQATDFGLRHHMIQQVQNSCQFYGLQGDDANRHNDKFLEVTQHMKQNRVSDDALRLSLFPYSLTLIVLASRGKFYAEDIRMNVPFDRGTCTAHTTIGTLPRNSVMETYPRTLSLLLLLRESRNAKSLGSGSLPSNTVANPRGDLKAITTRSGVSYDGPTIPPTSSPQREPEESKDKLADALLHLPINVLLSLSRLLVNKEKLFELANTSLNENCSAVLLKKLPKKLGDHGKFLIPFDYDVDPLVPIILGRPFLRTARALIDVHGEELILRDEDEQLIFHVDNTLGKSSRFLLLSLNIVGEEIKLDVGFAEDVIDVDEVLGLGTDFVADI